MKKYCKCNISLKKVLQYCKSCNKQYFANTLSRNLSNITQLNDKLFKLMESNAVFKLYYICRGKPSWKNIL